MYTIKEAKATINYPAELTKEIVEKYLSKPTKDTVLELAEKHDKSIKSIIGKLSKEGVYRREAYKTKVGGIPITKEELVTSIADLLDLEDLLGLEKAPKEVLKRLVYHIEYQLEYQ